jgi:hypothetical protein
VISNLTNNQQLKNIHIAAELSLFAEERRIEDVLQLCNMSKV